MEKARLQLGLQPMFVNFSLVVAANEFRASSTAPSIPTIARSNAIWTAFAENPVRPNEAAVDARFRREIERDFEQSHPRWFFYETGYGEKVFWSQAMLVIWKEMDAIRVKS